MGLARGMRAMVLSTIGNRKLVGMLTKTRQEDLRVISDLITAGKVKPVLDRICRLSETAEAIRYLETGHAKGKVVIGLE
jgi:NADPH:quinone reductase-like Zn-dependent oxidoreductase